MKPYVVSIDINLPRDRVVELFTNPDNLVHWQTGLQHFEHLSGEPGQLGSQSKLTFRMGKKRLELFETVTLNQLPERIHGTYEWDGGMNTLENKFVKTGRNTTRWESTCHYQMKSIMLKLMSFLLPGMFRKQNLMFLQNFKAFAESGVSVKIPSTPE